MRIPFKAIPSRLNKSTLFDDGTRKAPGEGYIACKWHAFSFRLPLLLFPLKEMKVVSDISENRKLYVLLKELTGQISLLKWNCRLPDDDHTSPLLISQNIGSDEKRFIRVRISRRVSDERRRSKYKPLVVLDIDRRTKLAWMLAPNKRNFTSVQEGSRNQDSRAVAKLNSVLGGLIHQAQRQKVQRQKPLMPMTREAKEKRKKLLAKEFNIPKGHESRVKRVKKKIKTERQAAQHPLMQPRERSTPDLLQTRALYQRLTNTFGDLENGAQKVVARGETADSDTTQDIIFERHYKGDTFGLFMLHTAQPGNSGARTLVAAFLVNFMTMQAQATPDLELLKGAYTLAMRAPEHVQEIKGQSHLGALLPLGTRNPVAREKAYSKTLSMVGVNPAKFQATPKRFLSSGQRLSLFCNMASEAMLRQLKSAGYKNIPYRSVQREWSMPQLQKQDVVREDGAEVVTVVLPDGRERTLTVNGLKDGESSEEVIRRYLQEQDQKMEQQPKQRASLNQSWG